MNHIIRDSDSIFEDMVDVEYDAFQSALEDLVDVHLLTKEIDDDEDRIYFRAREGLSWSDVVRIDCPIKKQVLLALIENPRTFFVLYNTQKGKLRIASVEIREWSAVPDKKVVAFLIVDNDKTLGDQTADGVFDTIGEVADLFRLSSNSTDTVDYIKNRIDSYAAFGGKMPVIVALNNGKQIRKIVSIMNHIRNRMDQCPQLRYGIVFDEADKIYPGCRSEFSDLLVDDARALHRLGFVTATEGDLLEADYPECANAYMYPVPLGNPNYRAIHTEDAEIKYVQHKLKDSNDVYAEGILTANRPYFWGAITLKDGSRGFRKVIVNGGSKTSSMDGFARRRVEENAYAITVNMMGVYVYRPGHEKKRYSAKGIRFSQLLFNIYTELKLDDKPLFIIGRRKVDRGLGFHHVPRDGVAGLVFTDMILGRVDDKATAVQKAGRLAGVVAHCAQYPGKLTWWTDERTALSITRHNNIVDDANARHGCSALQAVTRAEVSVPVVPAAPKFKLSRDTFDTVQSAKDWWKDPASVTDEPHDVRFNITQYRIYETDEGKCIKYRGGLRRIITESEARGRRSEIGGHITNNTPARIMPVTVGEDLGREGVGVARILPVAVPDIQSGIASSARVMPVEATNNRIKYIVVYKPDAVYQPRANGNDADSDTTEV